LELLASAQNILPEIIDLRRKIHANPELGNHLPETTKAVVEALAGLELDIRYSSKTTSLVATLQGAGNGPRIMLRGDMDALPMPENNDLPFSSKNEGMMHACGHDSHTAMLVGAAKILHANRDKLNGSVDFFFQTGEEGHFGAKVVLDEGLFESPHSPTRFLQFTLLPYLNQGRLQVRRVRYSLQQIPGK